MCVEERLALPALPAPALLPFPLPAAAGVASPSPAAAAAAAAAQADCRVSRCFLAGGSVASAVPAAAAASASACTSPSPAAAFCAVLGFRRRFLEGEPSASPASACCSPPASPPLACCPPPAAAAGAATGCQRPPANLSVLRVSASVALLRSRCSPNSTASIGPPFAASSTASTLQASHQPPLMKQSQVSPTARGTPAAEACGRARTAAGVGEQ